MTSSAVFPLPPRDRKPALWAGFLGLFLNFLFYVWENAHPLVFFTPLLSLFISGWVLVAGVLRMVRAKQQHKNLSVALVYEGVGLLTLFWSFLNILILLNQRQAALGWYKPLWWKP